MSTYVGRHARLYDLFYADKPYKAEAEFVHRQLQRFGAGSTRRLMELACGTGSHAFVFESMGYDVIGADYSQDIIRVAREKAESLKSGVEFVCQDMRAIDPASFAPFDAVVCLFDSVGYLQTNKALLEVMDRVHSCLRDEGLFVFEFWHAGAMLRNYDPIRVRRWKREDDEVLRISNTKLDCARQLGYVSYDIYELCDDGSYSNLKETHVNRYFLVEEMRLFLGCSGFSVIKFHSGFSDNEAITEETWHVVVVARKVEKRAFE